MSLLPDTGAVELKSYAEFAIARLANNERLDGRQLDEVRAAVVVRETYRSDAKDSGSISTNKNCTLLDESNEGLLSSVLYSDRSRRCVQATVHAVFGPPRPGQPDQGRLNVYIAAPLVFDGSSPLYGRGQILSSQQEEMPLRVAEGYVREVLTSCLDLRQLSILVGEACWVLTVTLTSLHMDGGLRPACLHAAVAALKDLVLPRARLPNGEVVEPKALRLSRLPVACTYGIHFSKAASEIKLIADPSAIEEYISETSATVTLDESGGLVGVQFGGPSPLQPSVLTEIVDMWVRHAAAFHKALYDSL